MVGVSLPLAMEDHAYSAFPLGRKFPVLILALFALVDVVTIVGGGSPWLFNLLFTVGVLFGGYWFLWLVVSELYLSGETIKWRSPMRSGEVRTIDIRRIRPGSGLSQNMEIIEMDDGEYLRVMGSSRFASFCDVLQVMRPDLSIQPSLQTRLMSRLFKSPKRPSP
jgi:hypothetical protein